MQNKQECQEILQEDMQLVLDPAVATLNKIDRQKIFTTLGYELFNNNFRHYVIRSLTEGYEIQNLNLIKWLMIIVTVCHLILYISR